MKNKSSVIFLSNTLTQIQIEDLPEYYPANIDKDILNIFFRSSFIIDYPQKVLILIEKFLMLAQKEKVLNEKLCRSLFIQSRLSFMGTDGMRGSVKKTASRDCLRDYFEHNIFSEDMVFTVCKAFTAMLIHNNLVNKDDVMCTAGDGRDMVTSWALTNAMNRGLSIYGNTVHYLGIVPTPAVPYYMIKNSFHCGAVLTASHNPSSQNGIKFFIDGRKLLPEGLNGDFELSAFIFLENLLNKDITSPHPMKNIINTDSGFSAFFSTIFPDDLQSVLGNSILFFDSANGAWTDTANEFFLKKNIHVIQCGEKPSGSNINQHCGAAEIEGEKIIQRSHAGRFPGIVRSIFNYTAEHSKEQKEIIGISVDGDGGLLLYYEKDSDVIYILNGDDIGIILAEYLASIYPQKKSCVFTIESDFMISKYIEQTLKLSAKAVGVGDKWICNNPVHDLLIGFESSGHSIIPQIIETHKGKTEYRAGNGLLSGLLCSYVICKYYTDTRFLFLYKPCFSKTNYIYFIHKSLFFKQSSAWEETKNYLIALLQQWIQSNEPQNTISITQIDLEDSNVLYIVLMEQNIQKAVFFIRNSGTEDKTGVYLKCGENLAEDLSPILQKTSILLRNLLQNTESREFKIAELIILEMNEKGLFDEAENSLTEKGFSTAEIRSVLHALSKEQRIKRDNTIYIRGNENE